jgi:hypothetical protein
MVLCVVFFNNGKFSLMMRFRRAIFPLPNGMRKSSKALIRDKLFTSLIFLRKFSELR